MRLALAVVPPMSKEMTLGKPSAWPTCAEAMMPPTGPDSIIATGRSVATSGVITPPFERMIDRSPLEADAAEARLQALHIAADLRPDIGVHHRRRHPLELAVLAQDLVRQRQVDVRHAPARIISPAMRSCSGLA